MNATPPHADVTPRKGLVGFFDILGYQSFLDNNNPTEEGVKQVLMTLATAGKEAEERFPVQIGVGEGRIVNCTVLSDTILITTPFEDSAAPDKAVFRWLTFIMVVALLNRRMFDYGLPLRGVIDVGEFVSVGNCFAGKVIADAYRLSKDLDLAAIVMTKKAEAQYGELFARATANVKLKDFPQMAFCGFSDYQVTRRSGLAESLKTLNLFAVTGDTVAPPPADVRQYILESFWKHKKTLRPQDMSKLVNTELLFRYLLSSASTTPGVIGIGAAPTTGIRFAPTTTSSTSKSRDG